MKMMDELGPVKQHDCIVDDKQRFRAAFLYRKFQCAGCVCFCSTQILQRYYRDTTCYVMFPVN